MQECCEKENDTQGNKEKYVDKRRYKICKRKKREVINRRIIEI